MTYRFDFEFPPPDFVDPLSDAGPPTGEVVASARDPGFWLNPMTVRSLAVDGERLDGTREWYAELPSTQDRAIARAREGAEEGARVVARRQGRGRGRLDRRWESPVGGLYLSVIVRSPEEHAGLLPLALGASLAEVLGQRYSLALRVKWPNDLLVAEGPCSGRKLAGILVDRVASPRLGTAAVVGIGVNVSTDRGRLPPSLRADVAVLTELCAVPPDVQAVETVVVDVVLRTAETIRSSTGRDELRTLCRRKLWGVGRRASIDGHPAGTIVALGDDGELLVEDRGRRMAIRAGDLRVEEAA